MKKPPLPLAQIQARIHIVRGKRVMLDVDLARFYGVTTRDLNKAVTRNIDRFPDDFAFHVLKEETQNLMFQVGTSSSQATAVMDDKRTGYVHGGTRKPARAFTEQGVAMLASVLRSPRAVAVSVALVRAFVQLRELLATHRELATKLTELEHRLAGHDTAIHELFETIRQLLEPPETPAKELGFHTLLKKADR
jgi:ORF6N domain